MMAARDALPVSEVLFLFFTGPGGSFLSQKEKEKNGGANDLFEIYKEEISCLKECIRSRSVP